MWNPVVIVKCNEKLIEIFGICLRIAIARVTVDDAVLAVRTQLCTALTAPH
jgi:hypothetical protein